MHDRWKEGREDKTKEKDGLRAMKNEYRKRMTDTMGKEKNWTRSSYDYVTYPFHPSASYPVR